MDHPLCVARLLEVGEAERPGGVLGIDHVAYTKGDRLAPDHDLITYVGSQRAGLVLPPGVTHLIRVVPVIHEMTIAGRLDASVVLDIRAVPRIRRRGHEPFAYEEVVVLVKPIVFIHLQQRARYREIVAARREVP